MAEREPGPYWVRDRFEDEWVVAYWTTAGRNGAEWQLHGVTDSYRDADFIEIGPRAELPPPVIESPTPPKVVHYDMNTQEGKRALMAAFQLPQWPEPQPITDAQKTGERFLVQIRRTRYPRSAHGWVEAYWDSDYWMTELFMPDGELIFFDADEVTHSMPLPPPPQWSDEG